MSWTENAKRFSAAAAGIKLLSLAGAVASLGMFAETAHAGSIVVRSNGPSAASYPPGKQLPAGGQVSLKAGDTLTVLDSAGTHVLKGPGNVSVSGSGTASANGISALLADTGVRQTRTGATRGVGGGAPHPTNVWAVDSTKSGSFCVTSPSRVSVWRADNAAAGQFALTSLADGKKATLDFSAGESVHSWPVEALPVADGARYKIAGAGVPAGSTITTRVLGAAPATLDDTASALLSKGCSAQLDLLVESTKLDED